MLRWPELCVKNVRKNVLTAAFGQILVEPLHFRQAATNDNHVGVEKIDHSGQGSPQTIFIAMQRCFAGGVASACPTVDFGWIEPFAGVAVMVGG
jgi:hypothetical protein